ncbi:MAG: acylglycerol kinase family protein [Acidimicrobiia bacterium]
MSLERLLSTDHDLTVLGRCTATRDRVGAGGGDGGAEAVFVLGGDGTLNETADGLAGTQTALAVLPGGSTNVFAAIGVEYDPVEAGWQLLAALGRARCGSGPRPRPGPRQGGGGSCSISASASARR